MKFGVLGPVSGDAQALERAVRLLLFELSADEVIYLGDDAPVIDALVLTWARGWVGDDASDEGVWRRAVEACGTADPAAIDAYVAAERGRERLRDLKCLGHHQRTVEMLEGRLAVFIHDKSLLDEDDILPASLLVFGKSVKPLVRQVGSRTFVTPGALTGGQGGIALFFDDPRGELALSFYEPGGAVVGSRVLPPLPAGRVLVHEKRARAGEPT